MTDEARGTVILPEAQGVAKYPEARGVAKHPEAQGTVIRPEARDVAKRPEATLVVKLGYRGGAFSGFAEQEGQRTVAGELRHALECVLRREVELSCAGRTDAGVHALGQHVSVPVYGSETELEGRRMERSLSAILPDDVSVRGLFRAAPGFSARFDATGRRYRYRIACGNARPVMGWGHVWWLTRWPDLDVDAMDEAARALEGEHDFRSFAKSSSIALMDADGRSTCRRVTEARVLRETEAGEPLVTVRVAGNAFLHNMVRVIVGSLVEVGSGRRDAAWLAAALAARDRRAAGPTAPACGLTFEDVSYEKGALIPWT